ncbi:MAG: colanic acid biosynthesis glycosyltransferase WcaL [Clostridiaceae bacterium]|nr:colanic acid biosynthesis glycosyltransferase WcaL [Clostridiaceae bacterium]
MDTVAVLVDEFLPVTQTFIYEEITGIKEYNVIVLTAKRENEELFPFKNVYTCTNIYRINNYFSRIIKRKNVRLIHVKFGTSFLKYFELIKSIQLPCIVSFHGYDASQNLKQPLILSKYKRILFPNTDHIITVSPKLKENLIGAGCPPHKITVLWSGVNVEKFWYKPRTIKNNENVKILCVARLTEKKGLEYLIKAFHRVVKVRPYTELSIVGEGPLKRNLAKMIANLNLTHKIRMINFIPHDKIVDVMHKHHIFCLPSVVSSSGNEEGIPNVLKEACATGMPVVSTYHSGIPCVVKNGKNGFLVPERDVAQLADKLIYLVDHPEVWEDMGLFGRKNVEENFNKYTQAKKLEHLYSSFIE